MIKSIFYRFILSSFCLLLLVSCNTSEAENRIVEDFNFEWQFHLGDTANAQNIGFNTQSWRSLNLPHDWSIEGSFSEEHPTKPEGGALPAGIGWYRKTFSLPKEWKDKSVAIEFDGVYRNSEVWINGEYLGKRPNGYISFAYELTKHLNYGTETNIIAVRVDNSAQPNSRWYTGSGIYRNVRLVATEKLHVAHWGTFVKTPQVSKEQAEVELAVKLQNDSEAEKVYRVISRILNSEQQEVATITSEERSIQAKSTDSIAGVTRVNQPQLWSIENPHLYSIVTTIYENDKAVDQYKTPLGIRFFDFKAETGFTLNGVSTKILGVCLHHDNGALGAVANRYAIKRKLSILKDMGVNGIRTAHNPPSLELLQLCDEMGFIVQDEAFDVWKKKKVAADYHTDWADWYKKDLQDLVKRDRNHPSVFMWSIGNEIREQFDSTGIAITKELVGLVKELDKTRPVTCALTENIPEKNFIYQSGALDLLGFNYKHEDYKSFPNRFKGEKIIASETMSALATRGHYDLPAAEVKRWPPAHHAPFDGNEDYTVSAYDMVSAYWGSTHEETWKEVKKLDFIAGLFIWTGFDYLGEPIPYPYPARSSYFGIVDLAGFPKDVYYMYQSEWTTKPVLHLFPHWNWDEGQEVDVWAYYNNADEVELFLNGKSLGSKSKNGDDLHISWKVDYVPGILKAVSSKNGKVVLEKEIKTAGAPAQIKLTPDKKAISDDGYDLIYVTVEVLDENGNLTPKSNNQINFSIEGGGSIVGVDNGYQANLNSFKDKSCQVYNGKCIVIIQSNRFENLITLKASSPKLQSELLNIAVEPIEKKE
ncbi:sugar-binding domain-containing protein [Leeuwenhoekiella marinoflava]|uniref:Beta-galactosidase n=2 Tax=Leeuwenhoekiella marinoflava TaxID=988 RepID=A0A4Q0PNU7_9FLAO|nr:sugar-binding domain-containing protein [Leeuwenhoekiella marinoflava]RXG32187.1 beta-galactosidase [Leeuwenhoekiella marinoflava]SHE84093.1 beta-galactosidase [Leeuwenhoekiella marinoflava DSM 3653]